MSGPQAINRKPPNSIAIKAVIAKTEADKKANNNDRQTTSVTAAPASSLFVYHAETINSKIPVRSANENVSAAAHIDKEKKKIQAQSIELTDFVTNRKKDPHAPKADLKKITQLIDEQINRLNMEYKPSIRNIFVNKVLNRLKHQYLLSMKSDLNQNTMDLIENVVQVIQEYIAKKDITKGRKSKVGLMFSIIIEHTSDIEKQMAAYKINIAIENKKISALSLILQKNILNFLSPEDTQKLISSSKAFSDARGILKINASKDKFISLGIKNSLYCKLPPYINFQKLYDKLKKINYAERRRMEFWMLALLSGNENLIQEFMEYNDTKNGKQELSNTNFYIIKKTTAYGINALFFAAWGGSVDAMKFAVETLGIPGNSANSEGFNALHFAAWGGSVEAMKFAVETLGIPADSRTNFGDNALRWAAHSGSVEAMKYAVETLGIPSDSKNNEGTNVLHSAAESGSFEAFKFALNTLRIPANSVKNDGFNVYHSAARGGSYDVIKFVSDNLEIPPKNKTNSGINALHCATLSSSVKVMKFINIWIPADSTDDNGNNALHFAASHGSVHTMKYVVETLGIPADSKNKEDVNALHWAASSDSVDAVKLAFTFGIPVYSKDCFGLTALHWAAEKGATEVILFLRKVYRFDPLLQDIFREDAFTKAKTNLTGIKLEETIAALSIPIWKIEEF